MAVTLQRRCRLRACDAALTGGVSGLGDRIKQPLSRYLIQNSIRLCEPLYSPTVGGVLYTWWTLMGKMPAKTLAASYHAAYMQKERELPC